MSNYNDDCLNHDVWKPVISIKELSADTKINDALSLIKEYTESDAIDIKMMNN